MGSVHRTCRILVILNNVNGQCAKTTTKSVVGSWPWNVAAVSVMHVSMVRCLVRMLVLGSFIACFGNELSYHCAAFLVIECM
jgi:hypothetical protein